jgi:hypothetical protein
MKMVRDYEVVDRAQSVIMRLDRDIILVGWQPLPVGWNLTRMGLVERMVGLVVVASLEKVLDND